MEAYSTDSAAAERVGPPPSPEQLRALPKVLLHEHLDGGLRPETILELADAAGYTELPVSTAGDLANWFSRADGAAPGNLEQYLKRFRHTVSVLQTADALYRAARECAEDLAADGIIYAEIRYAPELHRRRGLSLDDVVEAVTAGLAAGAPETIKVNSLLSAIRNSRFSHEIAELAARWRDAGVVGVDLAGLEPGFPPSEHLKAFHRAHADACHITIHAGEASGLRSIEEAVLLCGAERIGHGVRLTDDIAVADDGYTFGALAAYIRDRRVTLEMCPTSNVQTGAVASLATHPLPVLLKLGYRVTANTDNRLLSGVSLSGELQHLISEFGFSWAELERLTTNAMKGAFVDFEERRRLIQEVILPGFAQRDRRATDSEEHGPLRR